MNPVYGRDFCSLHVGPTEATYIGFSLAVVHDKGCLIIPLHTLICKLFVQSSSSTPWSPLKSD